MNEIQSVTPVATPDWSKNRRPLMPHALPSTEGSVLRRSEAILREGPPIRATVLATLATAVIAFGGFGGWAATAHLASGAIAQGTVRSDSNKKTVQHLEGGIIREILVKEGDRVSAGQVLVRLDPIAVKSDRSVVENQVFTALAEIARFTAEQFGAETITFPPELLAARERPQIAALIRTQEHIFASQRAALLGDIDVHEKKIEQQRAQIEALTQQIVTTRRQIQLFQEELAGAEELFAKGYEKKSRVLGLQRSVAAASGDLSSLQGKLETARETIAESRAQIEAVRRQRTKAASDDVEKSRAKHAEVEQQLQKITDKLERIDIVAPQDGYVLGLKYFTPGAVVGGGGTILDIIPDNDTLVMYVRINPLDIDVVHEGLPAEVRLVAYKQRVVPNLKGKVTQVSADSVLEEGSKTQFYMARVEVPAEELALYPNVKLYPGMPVEAVILTGERTVLDYLIRPMLDNFAHAFKEQ
ncbi:MAG: HlyD family type I secretion periplasmic adaptor subunit [Reyranella sp.]|nr:HlyD family type I secretion periplasmic adaptor subunit [Reyranella sp.]